MRRTRRRRWRRRSTWPRTWCTARSSYARTLGFDPAPDFDATRDHLGPWSGKCAITFGRDGKPFFIQGPRDNSALVVSNLRRSVGQDNFEYLIAG